MSLVKSEEEQRARTIFKMLAMSSKRVKAGKPMKPFEVALLKKVFPDVYVLCRRLTPEEITAINEQYKDHPTLGENVKIMLSPEGRAWLKETIALIHSAKE